MTALCVAASCSARPVSSPEATSVPTATVLDSPTMSSPSAGPMNPLTGQAVADPRLLKVPAVLVSISHFPATARPQAGLSFAPFVYEFYITEGATRFLAVFYGEVPAVAVPLHGGCSTRTGVFAQTANILGHLAWFDANSNGLQDPGERGIAGLCVNLYDAAGKKIQNTTTDSNGVYGFNVDPGRYTVGFARPQGLKFTRAHVGDGTNDSAVDPATGRVTLDVRADIREVNAGFVSADNSSPVPTTVGSLPLEQVGPIRSGRLMYRYVAKYFQDSCLIFGSASPEVLVELPKCLTVFHQISGGGFMLDISQLEDVARANMRKKGSGFDYSSYSFSGDAPPGGLPARLLRVFIAFQNQSGWYYDPLYQAYLRYVDTSEYGQAGVLYPDSDRLTERQIHFENVIVMFAQHEVVSPTNLDIHLDPGRSGKALLFRDGQVYKITWSTRQQQDKATAGVRPLRFLWRDGGLAPLKPGHTWIIVVTPDSTVEEKTPGAWLLAFAQPEGAK